MKKTLVGMSGFAPELIGEVVSIQLFSKKGGDLQADTLQKTVGVLKAYFVSAKDGGSFVIEGYSPRQFTTDRNHIEVFVLKEVER